MNDNNQNSLPSTKRFTAFVIGATGSVGAPLVEKLINSPLCERVTVISRRELAPSPKCHVVVWGDFADALLEHPEKSIEPHARAGESPHWNNTESTQYIQYDQSELVIEAARQMVVGIGRKGI